MIQSKQINKLWGRGLWISNLTSTAGLFQAAGLDVTTSFSGQTNGATNTAAGIFTTAPNNKIYIRDTKSGQALYQKTGAAGSEVYWEVHGRLTFAASVWTLKVYYYNAAGTETQITDSGVNLQSSGSFAVGDGIDFRYVKVDTFANVLPADAVDNFEGIDEVQIQSSAKLNEYVFAGITHVTTPSAAGEWHAGAVTTTQDILVWAAKTPASQDAVGSFIFEDIEFEVNGVDITPYITVFSWTTNVATVTLDVVGLGYSVDSADTVALEYESYV